MTHPHDNYRHTQPFEPGPWPPEVPVPAVAPSPALAANMPYIPSGRPLLPPETLVPNLFVWLLVGTLPVMLLMAVLQILWWPEFFQAADADDQERMTVYGMVILLFIVVALALNAAIIVFGFFDWRRLRKAGVVRPFGWAWMFLSPVVYMTGRTVVLWQVSRARSRVLAPMLAFAVGYLLVVVAGFAAAFTFVAESSYDQPPATASPTAVQTLPKQTDYYWTSPTPGYESSPHPLGTPAPLAETSDSYAFFPSTNPGQKFIAYDPCRPIHYVVRATNSPDGGLQMIHDGFNELSKVTGLQFVYDGPTHEAASEQRSSFQPGSYGDRWAPVLIVWGTPEEDPLLVSKESPEDPNPLGMGGSSPVRNANGVEVFVSGQVVLNAPELAEGTAVEGPIVIQSVIAHELAHLVGEDHVEDPTQLMSPTRTPGMSGYAAGDLTGLAQLGQGPCSPDL